MRILLFGLSLPPLLVLLLLLLPRARIHVVYDGACGMCRRSLAVLRALDWSRRISGHDLSDWETVHQRFPMLDKQACLEDMHSVDAGGRARRGLDAYRALAWRLPLFAALAWILYLPPVPWLGRRIYRRVADGRHREGCGKAPPPS